MKYRFKGFVRLALPVLLLLFLMPVMASAYIDPGSGSYMLQLLIGFLFASAYTIRRYWSNLKSFVQTRFGDKSSSGDEND